MPVLKKTFGMVTISIPSLYCKIVHVKFETSIKLRYHIYPNKSRAHIKAWARINAGVQYPKVNRRLHIKCGKGLI